MNLNLNTTSTVVNPSSVQAESILRRELLTLVPGTDSEYLLILDNTSATKVMQCPRSALFYLLYRRELGPKSAALTFGGAIHAGLEAFYKGQSEDEQNEAITSYFLMHPSPLDEYRTVSNALEVMQHYRIHASVADMDFRHLESPFIERAFELPLGVIPVEANVQLPSWETPRFVSKVHLAWSGKMDLAGYIGESLRLIDHKTTSMGGDTFTQDFRLSNQTIGYCWAFHELRPDLPVPGFTGNAIFFKRPTGTGSIAAPGPRGGKPALQFFRFDFNYSPERLASWEKNIVEVMADLVHHLVRNFFPAYPSSCMGKYGACQYHDVCTIEDDSVAMRMLQTDLYQDVTWDPTK